MKTLCWVSQTPTTMRIYRRRKLQRRKNEYIRTFGNMLMLTLNASRSVLEEDGKTSQVVHIWLLTTQGLETRILLSSSGFLQGTTQSI